MPIRIPNDGGVPILRQEGLVVMREEEAARQDIRPLEIAILNLMPERLKPRLKSPANWDARPPSQH